MGSGMPKSPVEEGRSWVYPARQGGTLVSLAFLEGIWVTASRKEKKKKKYNSFCPFDFNSHKPHPHRMTFNNQLAFQLLNIRAVSRGARSKRNPRGDPEQLTWLSAAVSAPSKFAPKLDLPSTLLLNKDNKIPQCRPYPGGGEAKMAPWDQSLAQAAQSWLALRHVTLMLCSSWSM